MVPCDETLFLLDLVLEFVQPHLDLALPFFDFGSPTGVLYNLREVVTPPRDGLLQITDAEAVVVDEVLPGLVIEDMRAGGLLHQPHGEIRRRSAAPAQPPDLRHGRPGI